MDYISNFLKKNRRLKYFLESQLRVSTYHIDEPLRIKEKNGIIPSLSKYSYYKSLELLFCKKNPFEEENSFMSFFNKNFSSTKEKDIIFYDKLISKILNSGFTKKDIKNLYSVYLSHKKEVDIFILKDKSNLKVLEKAFPFESVVFLSLIKFSIETMKIELLFNFKKRKRDIEFLREHKMSLFHFKDTFKDSSLSFFNIVKNEYYKGKTTTILSKDKSLIFLNFSYKGIINSAKMAEMFFEYSILNIDHKIEIIYIYFTKYNTIIKLNINEIFFEKTELLSFIDANKKLSKQSISFNTAQMDFIKAEPPVLSIAGPGSGKTETLITKVANYSKKIGFHRLLLLTFTTKASIEMIARLEKKIGVLGETPNVGTFHSVFLKILLQSYYKDWKLILNFEDNNLFKNIFCKNEKILKSADLNEYCSNVYSDNFNNIKRTVSLAIYDCKLSKKEIANYCGEIYNSLSIKKTIFEYIEVKEKKHLMNFDDILRITLFTLKKNKSFRHRIQNRFNTVFVDEFQDTNLIQYEIIKYISLNKNVVVVGDPNQSIYAFMNARLDNVINFYDDFDPHLVQMNTNYRSTENIISLTNLITDELEFKIKFNEKEIKKLKSNLDFQGEKINLISTNRKEMVVCDLVEEMIDGGTSPQDIAVIIRKNRDSSRLETLFHKKNIFFKKRIEVSFYEKKDVSSLIGLFLFFFNRKDYTSFQSFFEKMMNIGIETTEAITNIAKKEDSDIDLFLIKSNKDFLKYKRFREVLDFLTLMDYSDNEDFNSFEEFINKNSIFHKITKMFKNETDKIDSLDNLEIMMEELSHIYASSTKDSFSEKIQELFLSKNFENDFSEFVTITTAHSSKGLEWSNVLIMDVGKNNFTETREDEWQVNDEQIRLLYVSISRAKDSLFLIHQNENVTNGRKKKLDFIISNIFKNNEKLFEKREILY